MVAFKSSTRQAAASAFLLQHLLFKSPIIYCVIMGSWRSSLRYRRDHQDEWSQSRPSGTRLPRRRSEPHGSANWQQQPQSQSQDVRQPAPVFSASPSSSYYSAGWTPEPATESWEEYGLIVDEWGYYKVVVKRAVFVDDDLGPLIQISESGSRVVKWVPAKQETMYEIGRAHV